MWWKPRSIPQTGAVRITRYVVVHDCGRVINPMMLDGQVMGGVVNGIGATLYEWMRYGDDGQPLTVTYADYLLPTADTVPPIEIHHMESPTPLNPLGVKGAAESGTIGAPAAIVSAIEDALAPLAIAIRRPAGDAGAAARPHRRGASAGGPSKSRERMTARPSDDLPPALTTGGSGRREANAPLKPLPSGGSEGIG